MIRIRVEATAGSDIRKTSFEMSSLALKWNTPVVCKFKGVDVVAYPGRWPSDVEEQYEQGNRIEAELEKVREQQP